MISRLLHWLEMKAVTSLAAVLRFACGGANIPPPFEHDAVQLALDEEAGDPDSSASSVPDVWWCDLCWKYHSYTMQFGAAINDGNTPINPRWRMTGGSFTPQEVRDELNRRRADDE